jgi:hypothetical protein
VWKSKETGKGKIGKWKCLLSSGAEGVLAHVTGPFSIFKMGNGIFKLKKWQNIRG